MVIIISCHCLFTGILVRIEMQGMVILSCWVLGALQGAILILVPEMMLQGQLSALQLALPLSFGTFIFLYCSGRWGKLLDERYSTNKSILSIFRWALLGFFISQLSFLLLLQLSSFQGVVLLIALCASRILHGLFCSAIIPSAQLTLSRNDKKGEKLVWSSIAINIGRLTAPLLTFVTIDITYFSLWFIVGVTLLATIIAWTGQEKLNIKPDVSNQQSFIVTGNQNERFAFFTNPLLLSVCSAALLVSLFSSQLQFSLGPLLLAKLSNADLARQLTASLLFCASLSALISLFILYRPLSRSPKLFLSVITICLIVGCYLFATQQHLFVAITLISAALSMAPTWYSALAIHASKQNKARTSAAVSQGHTLGNAFGGLVGGGLLVFGQTALLLSFIFLMVFILLAWSVVYRQSNRTNNVLSSTVKTT